MNTTTTPREAGDQAAQACAAKAAGFIPHDDRAFGHVFSRLSKHGFIRCVGYFERKRGHGTAGGRIWEAEMIQVVSYGGGTNSTAMLVGLYERDERPDYIVFADTGSEKPHTYQHIEEVNEWCEKVGFPSITIIKADQPQQLIDGSLHEECLRLGRLPSKAYGFGGCSLKWKVEPLNKFYRKLAQELCITTKQIISLIGFDADETSRVDRQIALGEKMMTGFRHPLVEWGWGRDECIEAIARACISQPGKSACFMCPSSKKWEILELRNKYPELLNTALEIEKRAGEGTSTIGLGRRFKWGDLIAADEAQQSLFCDAGTPEIDCGCFYGD